MVHEDIVVILHNSKAVFNKTRVVDPGIGSIEQGYSIIEGGHDGAANVPGEMVASAPRATNHGEEWPSPTLSWEMAGKVEDGVLSLLTQFLAKLLGTFLADPGQGPFRRAWIASREIGVVVEGGGGREWTGIRSDRMDDGTALGQGLRIDMLVQDVRIVACVVWHGQECGRGRVIGGLEGAVVILHNDKVVFDQARVGDPEGRNGGGEAQRDQSHERMMPSATMGAPNDGIFATDPTSADVILEFCGPGWCRGRKVELVIRPLLDQFSGILRGASCRPWPGHVPARLDSEMGRYGCWLRREEEVRAWRVREVVVIILHNNKVVSDKVRVTDPEARRNGGDEVQCDQSHERTTPSAMTGAPNDGIFVTDLTSADVVLNFCGSRWWGKAELATRLLLDQFSAIFRSASRRPWPGCVPVRSDSEMGRYVLWLREEEEEGQAASV
ncbi:hypothetical protein BU15DRAFT_68401 [Melanogaster broomeanus]|nr:hypothetical protein BU15DRAFT_68401 [Melanogaster broomeanus]